MNSLPITYYLLSTIYVNGFVHILISALTTWVHHRKQTSSTAWGALLYIYSSKTSFISKSSVWGIVYQLLLRVYRSYYNGISPVMCSHIQVHTIEQQKGAVSRSVWVRDAKCAQVHTQDSVCYLLLLLISEHHQHQQKQVLGQFLYKKEMCCSITDCSLQKTNTGLLWTHTCMHTHTHTHTHYGPLPSMSLLFLGGASPQTGGLFRPDTEASVVAAENMHTYLYTGHTHGYNEYPAHLVH